MIMDRRFYTHGMVLPLISIILFSCGDIVREQDIIGIWSGEYNGNELLFEFNSDYSCVLSFDDKVLNTQEILNGDFEINYSKTPAILSIRNIQQLTHPLHTIIEFENTKSIRIAGFSPRWKLRPISFDLDTNMELERVND